MAKAEEQRTHETTEAKLEWLAQLREDALHGDAIVDISLSEATAELKTVPPEWYDVAKAFFG